MENHFEAFLIECLEAGDAQVRLVPRIDDNGNLAFYAHGQGGPTSGRTFDAVVSGKHVRRVVDLLERACPVDTETEDEASEDEASEDAEE